MHFKFMLIKNIGKFKNLQSLLSNTPDFLKVHHNIYTHHLLGFMHGCSRLGTTTEFPCNIRTFTSQRHRSPLEGASPQRALFIAFNEEMSLQLLQPPKTEWNTAKSRQTQSERANEALYQSFTSSDWCSSEEQSPNWFLLKPEGHGTVFFFVCVCVCVCACVCVCVCVCVGRGRQTEVDRGRHKNAHTHTHTHTHTHKRTHKMTSRNVGLSVHTHTHTHTHTHS